MSTQIVIEVVEITMIGLTKSSLIKCFENEFGNIETGFNTGKNSNVQIVKYQHMKKSPQFISTLGLSGETSNGNRFEWIMEISPTLSPNEAASVFDYYLNIYLEGGLGNVLRGSYVEFPKKADRVWKGDNSNGLYFTVPVFRSNDFRTRMREMKVVPIWVVPVTFSDLSILDKKGWRALEEHWDKNHVDLHTTYRQ